MPWVGWLDAAGACWPAPACRRWAASSSEWLLLQSFLFTPGLPVPLLNMLIPVVAALIALVAALAGYVMVKFFGVIFLGQPREDKLCTRARRRPLTERAGMGWLALGCVLLGLAAGAGDWPCLLDPGDAATGRRRAGRAWWPSAGSCWRPTAAGAGELRPVMFLLASAGVSRWPSCWCACCTTAGCAGARRPGTAASRKLTARMQDTAEGFGQPIRQIFEPFFQMHRDLPSPFDRAPRYRVTVPPTTSGAGCTCRSHDFAQTLAQPGCRSAAAGPHRGVPDVQLRHAGGDMLLLVLR
jgi:hydrogenase-4 component B